MQKKEWELIKPYLKLKTIEYDRESMRKLAFLLKTLIILLYIGSDDEMEHTNEITNKSMFSAAPLKVRRCKSRILYYANHTTTSRIILCGVIKLNPNPTELTRSRKLTLSAPTPQKIKHTRTIRRQ